ncbi:virion protein US2 [Felid alphaherpesvirus 1]|uniref:Virion protein US2 n=1 Tax=Feline herpesvirus 1 TaxID=10334 RepID=D1FXY4_FHV1|nr:virion protein US2 [Felid alphaherpesvirus 1]AMN88997.1 virion protein US2 [synthetic construct]ACT88360.1 virion protein US2 [Felid alphaherpesvirus 1]ALJ84127.1 virion protein US2 [Felid alphaherpesvirus 1]ALJ84203.1 virion protein US2 [Felid alphaherpesvirus 1]ALJ84279.1 virion protein US2 [Felid alphaherpesvirus 1]
MSPYKSVAPKDSYIRQINPFTNFRLYLVVREFILTLIPRSYLYRTHQNPRSDVTGISSIDSYNGSQYQRWAQHKMDKIIGLEDYYHIRHSVGQSKICYIIML